MKAICPHCGGDVSHYLIDDLPALDLADGFEAWWQSHWGHKFGSAAVAHTEGLELWVAAKQHLLEQQQNVKPR